MTDDQLLREAWDDYWRVAPAPRRFYCQRPRTYRPWWRVVLERLRAYTANQEPRF